LNLEFSEEAAIGAGPKHDLPTEELLQNHARFQSSARIPIESQVDLLPIEGRCLR
jgi:hypothetical protein